MMNSTTTSNNNDDVSTDLVCPISQQIMIDPVTDCLGFTIHL